MEQYQKVGHTITYKLHKIVNLQNKIADKVMRSTKLSFTQSKILVIINRHPEFSQRKMCYILDLTEAAVSKQIESLKRSGSIVRKRNPKNRRQHILTLTEKGFRAMTVGNNTLEPLFKNMLSDLDENEQLLMQDFLSKIIIKTQSYYIRQNESLICEQNNFAPNNTPSINN